MRYAIVGGPGRSFPDGDPVLAGAVAPEEAQVVLCLGGAHYAPSGREAAVLIELGTECLGVHAGEEAGSGAVLGFARYRNGDDPPSALVELVRRPETTAAALAAARAVLEGAGLAVVVCTDQAGRIIDRLVRPKYNAALRLLDEGLATQADMDLTCRMGLGYPDGPLERVLRGGLAHHHDVTRALFETYGTAGFAPARRAVVAAQRRERAERG
ncbi:3-hydroxyacyl-CoA dehydrogenase family protein [uncultured Methylobacterium sp.]|jgi:3-hydroxybutyryl-CoA dehydrogenase|uniref:3-hydroxyacyl-CoA dehydrogenase family protein n=1 Tax=uncultured Methylobacterium sp. TaxID=157278 RepID=UPI002638F884|nr:3-hydroxyacyl-CoA dehydrogenase family protein [uncultured Methylobacterium sp.]